MIRCYPVDGSESFEVDVEAHTYASTERVGDLAHDPSPGVHPIRGPDGFYQDCLIESWRERAERLERELAISRAETDAADAYCQLQLSGEGLTDIGLDEASATYDKAIAALDALRRRQSNP